MKTIASTCVKCGYVWEHGEVKNINDPLDIHYGANKHDDGIEEYGVCAHCAFEILRPEAEI